MNIFVTGSDGLVGINILKQLLKHDDTVICGSRNDFTPAKTAFLDDKNTQLRFEKVDVTDPEPLPPEHPFWQHPAIWLTPHIASQTQTDSAVAALLDNLRRYQRGEPMVGLIDRKRGY